MAIRTMKKDSDLNALLARSAESGKFFEKEGFTDLSDVIKYAIKRSEAN
ncbi:MAG: hypothetical protein WCT45_00080 [Candidatus Paceibacterota bacterium]|jgi:hypothetical protein